MYHVTTTPHSSMETGTLTYDTSNHHLDFLVFWDSRTNTVICGYSRNLTERDPRNYTLCLGNSVSTQPKTQWRSVLVITNFVNHLLKIYKRKRSVLRQYLKYNLSTEWKKTFYKTPPNLIDCVYHVLRNLVLSSYSRFILFSFYQ